MAPNAGLPSHIQNRAINTDMHPRHLSIYHNIEQAFSERLGKIDL